jgi:hypothetical protein
MARNWDQVGGNELALLVVGASVLIGALRSLEDTSAAAFGQDLDQQLARFRSGVRNRTSYASAGVQVLGAAGLIGVMLRRVGRAA